MIRFWCQCGRQLQSSENLIGQPAQCPLCRRLTIVPEADVPRTADFPPVPPRGNVNASGEIMRAAGEAPPGHPVPVRETPSPRRSRYAILLGATAIVVVILSIAVSCGVIRVREAAAKMTEANYLKQMGLAFHTFHDANGHFPAATAYRTKDGKPGLSWRVAILPYMEADPLYSKFKYDEPWDSPHNIRLLSQMPPYYRQSGQEDDGSGMTHYQVFVGSGTMFEEPKPTRPRLLDRNPSPILGLGFIDAPADRSKTILVGTARKAVPWTKPDDLPYAPDKPLPPLNERFAGSQYLAVDGSSIGFIPRDMPEAELRRLIVRHSSK